jgi:hypothetical protein
MKASIKGATVKTMVNKKIFWTMIFLSISNNRPVYAQARKAGLTPSAGGSGYEKPRSAYALCVAFLRHIS